MIVAHALRAELLIRKLALALKFDNFRPFIRASL